MYIARNKFEREHNKQLAVVNIVQFAVHIGQQSLKSHEILNICLATAVSRISFILLSVLRQVTASSTARSPHSAIWCSLFHFPTPLLLLKVIQQLLTSSSLSFRPLYLFRYLSFNIVFQETIPTKNVTNPGDTPSLIVSRILLFSNSHCDLNFPTEFYFFILIGLIR